MFPLLRTLSPLVLPAAVVASSSFTPDQLPNLSLWLKSDVGVYKDAGTTLSANNDLVQQWNDQSGSGNTFTEITSAHQPTYKTSIVNGRPVIRFTAASNTDLSVATNFPAPFTGFIVAAKSAGGSTMARVLGGVNNNWLLGYWNGARQQAYFAGTVNLSGTPAADTTFRCDTGKSDGSTGYIYENGSLIASSASGTAGPNGIYLGRGGTGATAPGEPSDCDIAEVIWYSSALSDSDRGKVESYLSSRYALGF